MDYEQTGMLLNQRITDDPNSKPKLMGQTCRLWRDLIETYSRNFLTNSQDKLIASSGIANCMRQITRGEYVASLWQGGGGFLLQDLLWHVPLREACGPELIKPNIGLFGKGVTTGSLSTKHSLTDRAAH